MEVDPPPPPSVTNHFGWAYHMTQDALRATETGAKGMSSVLIPVTLKSSGHSGLWRLLELHQVKEVAHGTTKRV